jgi:hypothetical protein
MKNQEAQRGMMRAGFKPDLTPLSLPAGTTSQAGTIG